MAAPVLGTYEYQYTDGGVLLNNSNIFPFIDVESIKGLDLPLTDVVESEYDSRHGGYIYAKYVHTRTIVIEGILYADASSVDEITEKLITNFLPRENDEPFYYKGSGIAQRYIMAKPIGLNFSVDNLRNNGTCAIQLQLEAGDPIKYIDKNDVSVVSGTTGTITNSGNTETFGVFDLVGPASEVSIIKIATGETVTNKFVTDADDIVTINFKDRTCLINDVRNTNYLTSLGWWSFLPNVPTEFKVISVGANTMVNGNCESSFGAGYAVGVNWTGLQQNTSDKYSGTKSLKMTRKNKTAGGGSVTVPTGVASQPAGTYTASVWLKGTVPRANVEVWSGSTKVAEVVLTPISSTSWKKIQLSYTLTGAGGPVTFQISDTGELPKALAKNKYILMDDFYLFNVVANVNCTVRSKDGWL